MKPELQALRRALEHDRYGLVAYALAVRDHCSPTDCAAFRSLTDNRQIVANMNDRTYDGLISHYAPTWNAPAAVPGVVAALPSSMPSGKPTNADFPSAASIPPINIMTPEPGPATTSATPPRAPASPPVASTPLPSPRPASATATAAAPAAPKKQAASKPPRAAPPVQLAPAAPAAEAPAPAAASE
jgi:hypothetical protein